MSAGVQKIYKPFNFINNFSQNSKIISLLSSIKLDKKTTNIRANSTVGEKSSFEGILLVQNKIFIHGKIIGNIKTSKAVHIGSTGYFEGILEAKEAVVSGTVDGKVITTGKLVLESTAIFKGELNARSLEIIEGASFCGISQMDVASSNTNLELVNSKVRLKDTYK